MLNQVSPVWLFATLWIVTHQAPLSMGIFQARILEWVSMPSSRESSQPRDRTRVSHIAQILFHLSHQKGPGNLMLHIKWPSMQGCFSHIQLLATPWTVASRLLCPWNFPGKNIGVGCRALLQGIFLTQGSNLWLLISLATKGRFFTTSTTWGAPLND